MAINNLNPRRTVWFSPHEPLNKYDIWLSKNAHYDENGEPTTDSNAQRDCDYIFKIYDCDKWNPIVGFNSTAKFKINTVANINYQYTYNGTTYTSSGIQQFHLPLFRDPDDSPAELFDAGTIGEAILQFVSETDWQNIFDSDQFINTFNSHIIEGDSYNWSTLINSNIDFATTSQCGGILSDIHPNSSAARRAGIQVRFTSTDRNLYDHDYGRIPSHHLAITGDQIINTINDWYNENPGQPGININIENIIQQIIDTFDDEYPLLIGGNGILVGQDLQHTQITWKLQGLETATDGYFPRSKTVGGNHEIEWVDLSDWLDDNFELELASTEKLGGIKANTPKDAPIGTYEECVLGTLLIGASGYQTEALFVNVDNIVGKIKTTQGLTISQSNEICIDTIGASSNDILYFDGTSIDWRNVKEPSQEILSNIQDIILSGISGSTRIIETNHRYIVEDELRKLTFISYRNNKIIVPSFVDFVTDVVAENPAIKFDNTYEFVETYTVNSSTYTGKFSYSDPYYILALEPETKYVVTLNGNKIYVDEVSDKDSLFNVQ